MTTTDRARVLAHLHTEIAALKADKPAAPGNLDTRAAMRAAVKAQGYTPYATNRGWLLS